MPLSISNSNDRLPSGAWSRTWGIAAVILILALSGLEVLWRSLGYLPSVNDDAAFWAMTRIQTGRIMDEEPIILVGTSRTQTNFNLDVMKEILGKKPISLAVVCSSPIQILEDLAHETNFNGTILCEYSPEILFGTAHDLENITNTDRVLNAYDRMKKEIFGEVEKFFVVHLQVRFTFLNNQLTLEDQFRSLITRSLPKTPNRYRPDRARFFDDSHVKEGYPDIDIPAIRPLSVTVPEEHQRLMERLVSATSSIINHGGQIVFISHPCRGSFLFEEVQNYPHNNYLNPLKKCTGAIVLHKDHHPALNTVIPKGDYIHWRFMIRPTYWGNRNYKTTCFTHPFQLLNPQPNLPNVFHNLPTKN